MTARRIHDDTERSVGLGGERWPWTVVPTGTRTAQPSLLGSCKETLIIFDDDDLVPSTAGEWVEWEAELDRGLDTPGIA